MEFYLEKIDIFGHPISFTHKGRSTYKTKQGGIATILTVTLTLILLIVKLSSSGNKVIVDQ
jgi:hypothetical protein